MVKRIKTPPPPDDEPKYYTVVGPYPLNCNWEYDQDYISFCRWVACCLGTPNPLFAVYHKPSAPNMVIIEVQRDFDPARIRDFLLGAHQWSQFLKNPSREEDRVTKVFHCFHSSGREVQKDGFLIINVKDEFFSSWNANNGVFHDPYPKSTWCSVPAEDITNKALCRPLPTGRGTNHKPDVPSPAAPKPVVGSATWVANKHGGGGTSAPSPKWSAIAAKTAPKMPQKPVSVGLSSSPSIVTPKTTNGAWTKPLTSSISGSPVVAPARTAPLNSPSAWTQPLNKAVPSSAATSVVSSSASSATTTPAVPPGLRAPAQRTASTSTYASPPGLTRSGKSGSSTETSSTSSSGGASSFDWADDVQKEMANITISPSQEAQLYEGEIDPNVYADGETFIAPWEAAGIKSATSTIPGYTTESKAPEHENLWLSVVEEKKPEEEGPKCPVHVGKDCKKGICKAYSEELRRWQREQKEQEKRENAKTKRTARTQAKKNEKKDNFYKAPAAVDEDGFSQVGGKGKKVGRASSAPTGSDNKPVIESSIPMEDLVTDDPWAPC